MKVYMLEDTNTGLFYRRRQAYDCWVEQGKASIWTNRVGPSQARTYAHRMKNRKPVVQIFTLEKV
jgi:hypothetical protein